jgi:hypothetical protein
MAENDNRQSITNNAHFIHIFWDSLDKLVARWVKNPRVFAKMLRIPPPIFEHLRVTAEWRVFMEASIGIEKSELFASRKQAFRGVMSGQMCDK